MAGVFTGWLKDRKRGDVDQTTLIFAEWKKINDEYKAQIEPLKAAVKPAERAGRRARQQNRKLRDENEGLKRQLGQKAQSEVVLLGGAIGGNAPAANRSSAGKTPMRDLIAKLDRA